MTPSESKSAASSIMSPPDIQRWTYGDPPILESTPVKDTNKSSVGDVKSVCSNDKSVEDSSNKSDVSEIEFDGESYCVIDPPSASILEEKDRLLDLDVHV